MKIKSHNINQHSVSIERIKKLGFDWHELFNPSLAIHANRELNMSKIKLVGFDMDYTLAVYKKRPMEFWQYELARQYLVQNMNYPDALYASNYNADLVIRGLVIDKHLGNILKVDDQNFVWRAVFGKTPLLAQQIADIYGTKRIKISGDRFYSLDTFFSIPEAGLFIDTIECLERLKKPNLPQGRWSTEQGHINFFQVFTDIRFAMDSIHSNGSLKTLIRDRIEEFIEQDVGIGQALVKLRQEGRKTFLLTNSSFDYTNTVLSYVFKNEPYLKKSWLELFDWVIVEAEKPKFFTEQRSFLPLLESHIYPGKIIARRGNIHDFQQLTKLHGSEVLYVGDHIYGDVLRSKKESLWRTCLIIKELNFDIRKSSELKHEMKSLRDIHHEQLEIDKQLMRLRTLRAMMQNYGLGHDKKAADEGGKLAFDLKTEIGLKTVALQKLKAKDVGLNRLIEDHFHPLWGRLFREDRELSRFGAQVRQYACLYTDHVKNFLHYDADHTFFAKMATMSHEIEDE